MSKRYLMDQRGRLIPIKVEEKKEVNKNLPKGNGVGTGSGYVNLSRRERHKLELENIKKVESREKTTINDKILVIITCFNSEKTITKSINSVLLQTYKNFYLLIVDDCSTDNTYELIKSFNDPRIISIRNEKNLGTYLSRNEGLLFAKSFIKDFEFFCFHDSDDLMKLNKLESQIHEFEKNPNKLGVSCGYRRIDSKTNEIISEFGFTESTIMFKKEVFDKLGYFDNTRFGGDTEYYNRFLSFFDQSKLIKSQQILSDCLFEEGKNLTSVIKNEDRIKYKKSFTSKHLDQRSKGDFYLTYKENPTLTKELIKEGFEINEKITFRLDFEKNSVYILKIKDKRMNLLLSYKNGKGVLWNRKFSPIILFITDDSDEFLLDIKTDTKILFQSNDFIFEKFSSDTNGVKLDEKFDSVIVSDEFKSFGEKNLLILNGIDDLKKIKSNKIDSKYIISKHSISEDKIKDLVIPRFDDIKIVNQSESKKILNAKKVVSLATYPKRRNMLIETINSLINQFDFVNVYLNNYNLGTIDDELIEILNDSRVNYIIDPFGNYRAAGKFFWMSIFDCYHFVCDDDITYPKDYFDHTIKFLDDQSMVGYLGVRFNEEIVDYPQTGRNRPTNVMFSAECKEKIKVHLIGTGVMALKNKKIFPDFSYMLQFVTYNDDLLSIYAKKNGISLYTIPKDAGWIKGNEDMEFGLYEEKVYDPKIQMITERFRELNPWK